MPIARRHFSLLPGAIALLLAAAGPVRAQGIDSVRITHPAADRWQASYFLSAQARAIEFERPAAFYRERVWTIATPGFRWERRGDRQFATADSTASSARRVDFTFAAFAEPLPKEYELFIAFSDGGTALYTGHFNARVPTDGAADATGFASRLTVDPGAGQHALVKGRVMDGAVSWSDSTGDGTYIYLGPAAPIETSSVLAIVDPGMPPWLETMASNRLPELFDDYTRSFGLTLPWKPTVLYAFRDTTTPGLSSGGGTLDGLVTLTLTGEAWKEATPDAREQAFALLAHESFHFWNGQVVENDPSPAGAWIHEGSADAMAALMALKYGIVDSVRARGAEQSLLNRCVGAVARGPVSTALARGHVRQVYDCGAVMALWTGLAVRRANGAGTLITFWRRLLQDAVANGRRYDQARYFNVLGTMGVDSTTIATMKDFVGETPDVEAAVASFQRLGARIRGMNAPSDAADQVGYARDAFANVMTSACKRVSFYSGVPIRTDAITGCAPFAEAMAVDRIEGLAIAEEGARIYDQVREVCAKAGTVRLGTTDGREVEAPCTRPLAPRPLWYVLDGLIVP